MKVNEIPEDWLKEEVTIEEIEKLQQVEREYWIGRGVNLDHIPEGPFGHAQKQWEEFKIKIKQGDKLVRFDSPQNWWAALAGREGVAIVRNGIPIEGFAWRFS